MPLNPANWSDSVTFEHDPTVLSGDVQGAKLVLVIDGGQDFSTAKSDGSDIRVTDDTDEVLPYEIEEFDRAADRLIVWFRKPFTLSSTTAQEFRLYWGNPSASDAQDAASLWSAVGSAYIYENVRHHKDGARLSASAGSNHTVHTGAPSALDPAKIGSGSSYDDVDDADQVTGFDPTGDGATALTVEGWIRVPALGESAAIFSRRYNSPLDAQAHALFLRKHPDDRAQFLVTADDDTRDGVAQVNLLVNISFSANTWYYFVGVHVPNSHTELWVNGVKEAEQTGHSVPLPDYIGTPNKSSLEELLVGADWIDTPAQYTYGDVDLDECRWAWEEMDQARIVQQYENMNSPVIGGTFWSEVANSPPAKPTITVGTRTSAGLALSSSAYSDPDGDPHQTSQWQVDEIGGDFSTPVYDTGAVSDLEDHVIPSGNLTENGVFQARVRHSDALGSSSWSDPSIGFVMVGTESLTLVALAMDALEFRFNEAPLTLELATAEDIDPRFLVFEGECESGPDPGYSSNSPTTPTWEDCEDGSVLF